MDRFQSSTVAIERGAAKLEDVVRLAMITIIIQVITIYLPMFPSCLTISNLHSLTITEISVNSDLVFNPETCNSCNQWWIAISKILFLVVFVARAWDIYKKNVDLLRSWLRKDAQILSLSIEWMDISLLFYERFNYNEQINLWVVSFGWITDGEIQSDSSICWFYLNLTKYLVVRWVYINYN